MYHPSQDLSAIERAYQLALEAHKAQLRKSGEPYIIHPLAVSIILAELELDLESIEAGLLHDVIEDSPYTFQDIVSFFGDDVAQLVDGVTKLDRFSYQSKEEEQAENYRKMFLAMANDIRVILVKIADRLHNMRTLKFQPPAKQKEIAQETLDIYCPLAHRLGISKLRYELEDLSFKYLYPEEYYDLAEKIILKQSERQARVSKIVDEIRTRLTSSGQDVITEGRPKHFFSIYKKMVSQSKTLDQIYDLFAVRVIVHSVRDCYDALGLLHEMYTPVPGRFKDYIAMPKSNKYQSLHTTLIGHDGEPFEVQIRTFEMHHTSEYGIAAHWKYKEGKGGQVTPDSDEAKMAWLRQILEWQRDLQDNREYLDAIKFDLNVFKNHVYCFTPKGEIFPLISGANTIDFAYAIHTAVGNTMVGARVNGKMVPIDYVLETGDRVEVLTSSNAKGPSADWLKIVKTSQARSKINQWFKKENRDENMVKGRELLEKEAAKKNCELKLLTEPKRLEAILNRFNCPDWDSLCAAVGHGSIKESQVISKLYEDLQKDADITLTIDPVDSARKNAKKQSGISINGIGDVNVRFSKCCNPVPGDEVVGFVTRGRGVSIHRTDCINIINLEELDRHRLIDAEWQLPDKGHDGIQYRADIRLTADDRVGLMQELYRVIAEERISVTGLHARVVGAEAVLSLSLKISGREQLERIFKKLKALPGMHDVERVIP
jgi:GTP pyrophosphokinase